MNFTKFICLILLLGTLKAHSQDINATTNKKTSGKYALNAAYFGETITHPGLTVGLEYTLLEGRKRSLISSVNLGGYTHPRHHRALFLNLEGGLRRTSSFGLNSDFMIGFGYFHTWANGEIYVRDGENNVAKIRNAGRPHFMTNVTLGLGWDFAKKQSSPLKIFLHLKPLLVYPVNHNLLTQVAIVAGGSWRL